MRNQARLYRMSLLPVSITLLVAIAVAKEPIKEQTWSFQGHEGKVKIRASQFERDSDNKPSVALDLWVEDGTSNIEEESRFLSFALAELPKSGFELSTLSLLIFRLDQTDAFKRIAPYAAKSSKWNAVARAHSAPVTYPVAAEMLNQCGAFNQWFATFQAHGIEGKVAGIEKLGMMTFRETGATCPVKVNCSRVLVPATALVQINLQPALQR